MNIEKAYWEPPASGLDLVIDGVKVYCIAKPFHLTCGIALVSGPPGWTEIYFPPIPVPRQDMPFYEGDEILGATRDPQIVAMVALHLEAKDHGRAVPGPVKILDRQTAEKIVREFMDGR